MTSLAVGFGLGFFVGAQPGPVSLLCIRSVLRGALASGVAIGAGAALIDLLYAGLGLAGAASLLEADALRVAFGLAGALVLGVIGARTLWGAFRVRLGGESNEEVASPRRAFATAVAATASNPLTIASWAAVFAAASTAGIAGSTDSAVAFVAGVGLGSMAWVTILALGVAAARARVGSRLLKTLDAAAGSAIVAFGGLLAWRTLRESS
jgi:threonine/homoserine/homoserine lactone efflux protein